jgi:hypothetical protein
MMTLLRWALGFVVPAQWAGLAAYAAAAMALVTAAGAIYWAGDNAGWHRRDAQAAAARAAAFEQHATELVQLQEFGNSVAADFAAAEAMNERESDALQKSIAALPDAGICLTADVMRGIERLR